MEPRARAARLKGQLNFPEDLKQLLHAFGALPGSPPDQVPEPYPETLRVLDEIVTDFIIEICHTAVAVASYSGRQKLKVDDFRFVMRKDPIKLGRMQQMYMTGKDISKDRKAFDAIGMGGAGAAGGKVAVGALEVFAEMGGEEGTGRGKGRGRGRKRKVVNQLDGAGDGDGDGEEGTTGKRARSDAG
ncbi:hypothetical protein GJ744_010944 [Endocarpon pusillum]|uniref:Transcription initiation factor TFIID subunit 13 n=1 Tax=Endocarpon pusillum TaxID=364733 RepID=A0A8H7E562_9EURO|nr:hypothetical protein GJ744_010944 [Endocarpon pusillum]